MDDIFEDFTKNARFCKYCRDRMNIDQLLKDENYCSPECALADLTGDPTFVYEDDE